MRNTSYYPNFYPQDNDGSRGNLNRNNSQQDDAIYLKVAEVEPILESCIYGSTFSEIHSIVQKIIPISESALRKYIFYLINNSFISYNGGKKLFVIESGGLQLLEFIYAQIEKRTVDYTDLMIKIQ